MHTPGLPSPPRAVAGHVVARSRRAAIWRPLALTVVGALLGAGAVALGHELEPRGTDVITIEASRALLAALAGTMVTATVVVFWIRGLIVGTRSGVLPARVLVGYLGDAHQQWVMGFMVGVFSYMAVVLVALPSGADATVPVLPVGLAVVLVVAALLMIVQSIESGSRSLHEQRILLRIVAQTLQVIDREYPERGGDPGDPPEPTGQSTEVVAWGTGIGWVQQIDDDAILQAIPEGAICHRRVRIGDFVTQATQLCTARLPAHSDADPDAVASAIAAAVHLDEVRSPRTDIALGLRSVVDVALSGLSASSADRTVAREAIAHIGAVVRPLLLRDGPPPRRRRGDRWMVVDGEADFERYAYLAFEDLRHARPDPVTAKTILTTIDDLAAAADAVGRADRAEVLRRHADLMVHQIRDHADDPAELRWIAGPRALELDDSTADA